MSKYRAFDLIQEAAQHANRIAEINSELVEIGAAAPDPLRVILHRLAPACKRIDVQAEREPHVTLRPENHSSPWDMADAAYEERDASDEMTYVFHWQDPEAFGRQRDWLIYIPGNAEDERIADYTCGAYNDPVTPFSEVVDEATEGQA